MDQPREENRRDYIVTRKTLKEFVSKDNQLDRIFLYSTVHIEPLTFKSTTCQGNL